MKLHNTIVVKQTTSLIMLWKHKVNTNSNLYKKKHDKGRWKYKKDIRLSSDEIYSTYAKIIKIKAWRRHKLCKIKGTVSHNSTEPRIFRFIWMQTIYQSSSCKLLLYKLLYIWKYKLLNWYEKKGNLNKCFLRV